MPSPRARPGLTYLRYQTSWGFALNIKRQTWEVPSFCPKPDILQGVIRRYWSWATCARPRRRWMNFWWNSGSSHRARIKGPCAKVKLVMVSDQAKFCLYHPLPTPIPGEILSEITHLYGTYTYIPSYPLPHTKLGPQRQHHTHIHQGKLSNLHL